jgi:tetratricopeptide (TPR) repeat protein
MADAPMRSPTLDEFQYEIGARLGRRDLAGAAQAAAQCRAACPSDRAGWLFGSIAALLDDKKEAALALIDERLAADPLDTRCLLQRAECLLALGARADALVAAIDAMQNAHDIPALDAVGEFLAHAGDYRRALEVYDRAVAAAPRHPNMRARRAAVHQYLGQLDQAAADYEAVLEIVPGDPKALKALVELRRESADRNFIAAMEAALAAAPAGSTDAAILHFGLAKSYEDLGEHAVSWGHLTRGNSIERSLSPYDPATDRLVMDGVIAGFPTVEVFRPDTTGERPIFIVGLPRTGTTLVDRIIGSHTQVQSAGELLAFEEAIDVALARSGHPRSPDWQQYAAALCGLDPEIIADEYLARSRARRRDRPRFTDKQNTNFLYCALCT